MIKVGITGGIGSGKSTVTNIFEILDIPVYIADIESKKLTATSPVIRAKLVELYGEDLYNNNILNKQLLASHIFNDKKKLAETNAIIHPEVDKHFCSWVDKHLNEPIVVVEAAILYESGMVRFVDKTILVYTSIEERITRVLKRDNTNREQVINRINSQMLDEEKIKHADFVIYNNERKSIIRQTLDIINSIL